MTTRVYRWVVVAVLALAMLASCSSGQMPAPAPSRSQAPINYPELEAALEHQISTGSVTLDNMRAVLVSVDGETRISHYRHGFAATDTTHVWSVTKSVVSTLVGITISEGILDDLDSTLGELLPEYRSSMSGGEAAVTLRQLMTMSGGFPEADPPFETLMSLFRSRGDLVAYLLKQGQEVPAGTKFLYSNTSSHLVAAVLASALRRSKGDHPRSLFEYARARLFEPLGIDTDPAWVKPLPDTSSADFAKAGFGWGTDPKGIPVGAVGLRLTAPDLVKLGELYRNDGSWHGRQIFGADWVEQVTTPSELQPEYGLMWWLYTWNGHQIYAARGSEGQLIVVVPDQHSVTAIQSANSPEYPMSEEDLFPLVRDLIIPKLDGS
jgi:CubicO group peptidase (beta-lactamase class C family)